MKFPVFTIVQFYQFIEAHRLQREVASRDSRGSRRGSHLRLAANVFPSPTSAPLSRSARAHLANYYEAAAGAQCTIKADSKANDDIF